jgi:hypothetical protein
MLEFYSTPERITGQAIAKCHWSARKRARLAAKWLAGLVVIEPTTKLAAKVFDVSPQLIKQELAWIDALPQDAATNSLPNGTTVTLDDDEKSAVAHALGEEQLWECLEIAIQ